MRAPCSLLLVGLCALIASRPAAAFRVELDYALYPGTTSGNILSVGNCGVTVAASGVDFLYGDGGGIGVHGAVHTMLDNGEVLQFTFPAPVDDVAYTVSASTSGDGDAFAGEHYLEAFGAEGSLDVLPLLPFQAEDVTSLFGGVPIKRLVLTGTLDGIRIGSVAYDLPRDVTITVRPHQLAQASYPELVLCGLTFEASSGTVRVEAEGLAVAGGSSDDWIDPGEKLSVSFDAPVVEVGYELIVTNSNGSGGTGQHFVEAFDHQGQSLGQKTAPASATVDLDNLYGDLRLSRFVLTGVDQVQLRSVTFVPEPASGGTAALAALLAVRGARRRALGLRS